MQKPQRDTENRNRSELDIPRWSVISFERCEESGLTYRQASEKVAELQVQKVPGLCIVTDEAASRVDR